MCRRGNSLQNLTSKRGAYSRALIKNASPVMSGPFSHDKRCYTQILQAKAFSQTNFSFYVLVRDKNAYASGFGFLLRHMHLASGTACCGLETVLGSQTDQGLSLSLPPLLALTFSHSFTLCRTKAEKRPSHDKRSRGILTRNVSKKNEC